jgi:hypothetical protein
MFGPKQIADDDTFRAGFKAGSRGGIGIESALIEYKHK